MILLHSGGHRVKPLPDEQTGDVDGQESQDGRCGVQVECRSDSRGIGTCGVRGCEELGIGVDLLYRWRSEMLGQKGTSHFPVTAERPALTEEQHRTRKIEKQIKDAELDRIYSKS